MFQFRGGLPLRTFAHAGRPDARPAQPAPAGHPGAGAGGLDGQPQVRLLLLLLLPGLADSCLTLQPSVCRYRVLAVDHDLFSFADLKFEQWPVVLVTNPKDAQYMHPGAEPLGRIRRSTHIRFLLFVVKMLAFSCLWSGQGCGRPLTPCLLTGCWPSRRL